MQHSNKDEGHSEIVKREIQNIDKRFIEGIYVAQKIDQRFKERRYVEKIERKEKNLKRD